MNAEETCCILNAEKWRDETKNNLHLYSFERTSVVVTHIFIVITICFESAYYLNYAELWTLQEHHFKILLISLTSATDSFSGVVYSSVQLSFNKTGVQFPPGAGVIDPPIQWIPKTLFSKVKRPECNMITYFYLVPKLSMCEALPPFSYLFM